MFKNQIPLSEPEINSKAWHYMKKCLDAGWVSSAGEYVNDFEKRIASYVGANFSVACVNGTAALHISLLLAGIRPGDEVIVPTVTFIAPVNTVSYVGAEPVFMDCDDYLNIDVEKTGEFFERECILKENKLINKATGKAIKAIIPVHIFGHPVDIEPLMRLAKKYKLKIIEDATESLGSCYIKGKYRGKKAGSIGDIGCLSFNGNKIITSGGGGMIITNHGNIARRSKYLTTQARDDSLRYIHNDIGYNYRLTNLQAALGLAQLEEIGKYIQIKRRNFGLYYERISNIKGLRMVTEPPYSFSNYWFYTLIVDSKKYGMSTEELRLLFYQKGIHSRSLWRLNHRQKPYRRNRTYRIEKADNYSKQVLNLPCSIGLSRNDINRVIKVLEENAKR